MPSNDPDRVTPREALDRIAALCDEFQTDAHPGRLLAQVRAVLAEVTPETGVILDRDKALRVLLHNLKHVTPSFGAATPENYGLLLDRLAACVRPATVDRDALVAVLGSFAGEAFGSGNLDYAAWADRILALVRPATRLEATQ
jgi:hypothetical protein